MFFSYSNFALNQFLSDLHVHDNIVAMDDDTGQVGIATRAESRTTLSLSQTLTVHNKFETFPQLPIELRNKIWKIAAAATVKPRLVKVSWSQARRRCISSQPPPVLLRVCHESRIEALKIWKSAFASSPEFAIIPFNFDLDTVYLDWESFGNAPASHRLKRKIAENDLSKITKLLMHRKDMSTVLWGKSHWKYTVNGLVRLSDTNVVE